jgi:hypothetical protein
LPPPSFFDAISAFYRLSLCFSLKQRQLSFFASLPRYFTPAADIFFDITPLALLFAIAIADR